MAHNKEIPYVSDIRRIQLVNTFRTTKDKGVASEKWNVLGYYDYLEVKPVINGVVKRNAEFLEQIWKDARTVSKSLQGSRKVHTIYAMTHDSKDSIDSFWNRETEFPILMVSIIHAYHEKEHITELHKRIKKYTCEGKNEKLLCLPYFSIDCSDIIVFWLTTSFQAVMQHVYQIYSKENLNVHDVFTLVGYNRQIILDINSGNRSKLLEDWISCEQQIDSIQILLRSPSLDDAYKLACSVLKKYQGTKHVLSDKPCLLAGQEDVLISLYNFPVNQLIMLFSKGAELDMDELIQKQVVSRTIIGSERINASGENKKKSNDIYEYANAIFRRLKSLDSSDLVVEQSWYAPLCELLNEFCSTEIDIASYDIYIQEILSHKLLVDYILYLVEQSKDPDNEIDIDSFYIEDCIHQYLIGWSQLSFHAMHSEWQLTQSSDVNRLYFYPTKLGMLYSSVLFTTARILSSPEGSNDMGVFYLTPTLVSHPQFEAVFTNGDDHAKLIQGRIPPDKMYFPLTLIPTLVHEAAHYVGRDIRCRRRRFDYMWNSLFYIFLHQKIISCINDVSVSVDALHDAAKATISEFSIIDDDLDIDNLRFTQTNLVSRITEYYITEYLTMYFGIIIDATAGCYLRAVLNRSKNSVSTIITRVYSETKPLLSNIKHEGITYEEIKREFDSLISVYQESFSDLCMVRILNLDIEDYLEHVMCMYGGKNLKTNVTNNLERARFWAVIHTCEMEEGLRLLLGKYEKYRVADNEIQSIYELIESLVGISTLEKANNIIARCEYYLAFQLLEYLKECNEKLNLVLDSTYVDKLRQIYRAFSEGSQEHNLNAFWLYEQCEYFIKECHVEIREELKRQFSN